MVRTLVALATIVALLSPGASAALAAGISVTPGAGAIGTSTSLSGNGFAAGANVQVFFNGSTFIGNESADGSGNLAAFSVGIPNVTAGNYTISATDNTNTATTSFTVPSGLTLTPSSGGPGTGVTVNGTGYLVSETVVVSWDQGGNQVASISSNGNGAFSASFSVPNSSGTHTVFATGQTSHFTQSATFTVSGNVGGANLSSSPTSGAAGSTVNLNGSGFAASEQVNIAVDNGGVASVTSDGNGNFGTNVTLSSSLAMGAHTISATGVSSGRMASVTFSVTSTTASPQPTSCSSGDDERPGNGHGDDNHCHTGPPGHQQHGEGNQGGHGHSHGDGNDQGEDD
jgi:hypothetical protein